VGRKEVEMKFKVRLVTEECEVIGTYDIDIVAEIKPEEFENDVNEGCLIEESDLSKPRAMDAHAEYLGRLVLNDVKAIYFQKK
jgi:hypothetical protein